MDMMWAPWLLKPGKARAFAYTGDWFNGEEMEEFGWATFAKPKDELEEFTIKYARRLGHIDNDHLNYSKCAVNR